MVRGAFAKKLGMTQIFTPEGENVGVTVLEVIPQYVLEIREYPYKKTARVGFLKGDNLRHQKKPQKGYFDRIGLGYFRRVREVEIADEKEVAVGKEVGVEIFDRGEKVDVQGVSKGKGFQGGMRRHNWAGQPKTHGSTTHRRIGSNGASAYPSRVLKGFTMPGHMGAEKKTIRNLQVVEVDKEKGVLFVNGSCPGARGSLVFVRKTV